MSTQLPYQHLTSGPTTGKELLTTCNIDIKFGDGFNSDGAALFKLGNTASN
jgi:hypothetical protein